MADSGVKLDSSSSCCALLKKRYSKSEEKRAALRGALNVLEQQITKLQNENIKIKKTCEEERAQAELEFEAKVKSVRVGLEAEILKLKSELASLVEKRGSNDQQADDEVLVLRTRVSEGEIEINKLKELLEKERKRGDLEKKTAEAEKKKSADAVKLVKSEKNKAEEERRAADVERRRAEEFRLRLEASELEIEAKAKAVRDVLEAEILKLKSERGASNDQQDNELVLLRTRVTDAEAETNKLKVLLEKERKRGDLEKKKAEAEKKKAAEAWKLVKSEKNKAEEERSAANVERRHAEEFRLLSEASETDNIRLRDLLEKEIQKVDVEKKRAETEKKEATDAWKIVKSKKKKAVEQRRLADVERKRAEECRLLLETSETEAKEVWTELVLVRSKTEEAHRRLEAEKQKADMEKKRAKLEMAKAEEQRKCLKEEKKKLMDEKSVSNNLSQQLKEERQRNITLEKELQEITAAREMERANGMPPDTVGNAANAKSILLRKQLKLKKMHVKHLKRVIEFEKMRNDLLAQEVMGWKQDFIRLDRRLNILVDQFSHGRKGIDALTKFRNSPYLQNSDSNGKLSGNEPCALYGKSQSEPVNAHRTSMGSVDHFDSRLTCSMPLLGCSSKSVSGISSELESVGVSVRNKSQSSAMYSTSTSLSDGPLVRSQGNRTLTVTSPARLKHKSLKKRSAICRLYDEINTPRINENLELTTENHARSLIQGHAEVSSLNSNDHAIISLVGEEPGHNRKRKAGEDALLSSETMCSKDKQSHTHIEEDSLLNDTLVLKDTPAVICSQNDSKSHSEGEGRCQLDVSLVDLDAREHGFTKKRKLSAEPNQTVEACSGGDVQRSGNPSSLPTSVCRDEGALVQSVPLDSCLLGTLQSCGNETADIISDEESAKFFEIITSEGYMKLLDLDNADDEQLYRMAMERPISPNLPEIEVPDMEEFCDPKYLRRDGLLKQVEIEKENTLLSRNDIVDVETGTSYGSSESDNPIEVCNNEEEGFHFTESIGKNFDHQVFEKSSDIDGAKQMAISLEGMDPCTNSGGLKDERICRYVVAFPNTNDKSSISRMVSACESCISKSSMVSQKIWVVQKILSVLAMEENLLPKEKTCVLFSLLLQNFSVATSSSFRNLLTGDSTLGSASFLTHMKTVMSDAELKHVLLELCQLDTLLRLIEGFLINRKVLVYNDESHEQQIPCDSGSGCTIVVDDVTMTVSSRSATTDQLFSGSIILASLCATTGHIDFICEATCNIMRTHRHDPYLVLTMLHVFASVCGTKYFTLSSCSLIMIVVKSLVSRLERDVMVGESQFRFHTCAQCAFSEGVISVDEVASLLLEKLENHTVPRTECQPMLLVDTSDYNSPDMVRAKLDIELEGDVYGLNSKTLNHFSDILSLLELVACYMSWDQIWNKIIPQLLKMLDLCASEKFAAAIIVLLGQLGRFAIDDSGHEQLGVEELRCCLLTFLDQKAIRKWALSTQFAIVHALIDLLSVDFAELVKSNEFPVKTSKSVHTNGIVKWFSQLSEEQKFLSFGIFQSADVHE